MEVVPTGLGGIDEDLRYGGLPAGSVVAVEYPPASAGEAFLWTLVARGLHPDVRLPVAPAETAFVHPDRVVYLSTGKAPATVRESIGTHGPESTEDGGLPLAVEHLDVCREEPEVPRVVSESDATRPAFVCDSVSDLLAFADGGVARRLLSLVRSTVRERDGIALLAFAREGRDWRPDEAHHLERCDGHVRFDPGTGGASAAVRFEHLRGSSGPAEGFPAVFNLDVGRRVSVDTVERG